MVQFFRLVCAVTAIAVILPGCSKEPKIVPVSGVVLIDGEPVVHGDIQFAPKGYRAAFGQLGPDGRFTLTTFKENDGAVIGEHQVAVIAKKELSSTSQMWYAPKAYRTIDSSGLVVNITGPTNDLKIELTWGGGEKGPFLDRFERE